jgi:hypothetical protein
MVGSFPDGEKAPDGRSYCILLYHLCNILLFILSRPDCGILWAYAFSELAACGGSQKEKKRLLRGHLALRQRAAALCTPAFRENA